MKTNAARILDALGLPYRLQEYAVDLEDMSAIAVARKIGLPPEQVFKTLLAQLDGRDGSKSREPVFAVIPGDAGLDLKKLARLAGVAKAELAPLKELEPLTGYIRGGCTVFGAKKPFRVFVDETIELFDDVSVSAGKRGLQILLSPANYLSAIASQSEPAVLGDLTKPLPPEPDGNQRHPPAEDVPS